MRRLLSLLALVVLVPTSAGAATHSVSMADHIFWSSTAMSSAITIRPGDTLTWENRGNTTHNAQAEDGSWASPNLRPGQSFSRTFAEPGEYRYICSLHVVEEMFGTVIVEDTGTTRRVFVPFALG
jgi:plastocyanin